MATGNFTAFPVPWNDSPAAFGLAELAGATFTGNVGIGVSPTAGLHLNKDVSSYIAKFERSGVTSRLAFYSTANLFYLDAEGASNEMLLAANAVEVLRLGTGARFSGPMRYAQYTLTTLPSAAAYSGYCIDVTNATGGAKICRSNGTVWQILNTTTTVS